ncbi:MAG: type II toxin-antitoxin system HicB family antitoxin [Solirubrobacteraceae bacterium]
MADFSVIYEKAEDGSWSVRAVDLPVFSVGDSREEAAESIREAIALYLEGGAVRYTVSDVGTVTV